MMEGRRYTFGTVRPFSQLITDHSSVPKSFPASLTVSFKSSRRFLMCSLRLSAPQAILLVSNT
jgi:hypothetical protein